MALNNKKKIYFKTAKKTALMAAILFLIVLNALTFMRYIAANPQKITEYQIPVDTLAEFRHPLPIFFYYSSDEKTVKLAVVPEQKFFKYQKLIIQALINRIKPSTHLVVGHAEYCSALQGVFTDVRCVPALNEQTLKQLLAAENTAVILFHDVADDVGADLLLAFVQKLNLRPRVFNVLNRFKPQEQVQTADVAGRAAQAKNLRNFAADYHNLLQQIIADKEFRTKQSEKNEHLFDRASVVVLACVPDMAECAEYGSEPFAESVYTAIKNNLKKARRDWPQREMKVFLLTDMFEQVFASEAEFENSLNVGEGVLLREKSRYSVLLPYFWQFYPEKKEFIKQLKIKSGLNPDYWSKKMQIYYFKAVEIGENEDF